MTYNTENSLSDCLILNRFGYNLAFRKAFLTLLVFTVIFALLPQKSSKADEEIITNLPIELSDKEIYLEKLSSEIVKIKNDKENISNLSAKLNLIIDERSRILKEIQKGLEESSYTISQNTFPEISLSHYNKITIYWRVLVDNSLAFFQEKDVFKVDYPESLSKPIIILDKYEDEKLSKQYLQENENLASQYKYLINSKKRFIELTEGSQSKLLLQSGKHRANLFNLVLEQNSNFIKYDEFYLEDLIRELKLIPYRPIMFFYSKLLSYKNLIQSGISGIITVASQIFFIIFSISILVVGAYFLKRITKTLEEIKNTFVGYSFQNQKYKKLSIIVIKTSPYFPWIALIVIFSSVFTFVEHSDLAEISLILPYFIYYFLYRIFAILTVSIFQKLLHVSFYSNNQSNLKRKIDSTSKILSLYFLLSLSFLHLTKTLVRKAMAYDLVFNIFSIILLMLLIYLAKKWSDEIFKKFNDDFLIKSYQNLASFLIKKSPLFSSLLLVLIICKTVLRIILSYFSKNDFVKKILAHIYRKKLETAAKKSEELQLDIEIPKSYLNNFKSHIKDEFIIIKSHPYEKIKETVKCWFNGINKENSLIIYGESGIGKTSLLNKIESDFSNNESSDLKIFRINFDQKVTKKSELCSVISKVLEIENCEETIIKTLENFSKKTLIILDRCEDLFLSTKGGFEAFKLFSNLVNVSSQNIFWFASFHRYSWNYLSNATDCSNYFRYQFKLPRWNDSAIKELILKKHKISGLTLTYDSLIFAMHSQDSQKQLEDVERKFFQMLWSQSSGNPNTAIYLWISALRIVNNKTLKITLPKAVKFSNLIKLSDEQLFIYAGIAKHRRLSIEEIIIITDLEKGVALNAIRIGVEKFYLEKGEYNRYCLSGQWQVLISNLLINKNFIYE